MTPAGDIAYVKPGEANMFTDTRWPSWYAGI